MPARTRIRLIEKRTRSVRFLLLLLFEDRRPHTSQSSEFRDEGLRLLCDFVRVDKIGEESLFNCGRVKWVPFREVAGSLLSRQRFNAIVRLTISDSATT